MRNALTILILVLVLVTSASAEFNAYGDTTVDTKICETALNSVYIENIESENQSFSISVSGKGADLIKFVAIDFALQGGQTAQINTEYEIECDQIVGEYPLIIYFTSGDIEKSLAQTIIVRKQDTVNLTVEETKVSITPCAIAEFKAQLHNPENITESYDISVLGHPDATVEPNYVFLSSRGKENITIKVEPQNCKDSGEYNLKLKVVAHTAETEKDIELTLKVENANIPAITPQADVIRTGYGTSTVKIPVKNTGNKETTYDIQTNGLGWVKSEPKTMILRPLESQDILLTFSPGEEIEKDKYPFNLSVIIKDTQIIYEVQLTARLKPKTYFEKNRMMGLGLGVLIILILASIFAWLSYINIPSVKSRRQKKKEVKSSRSQKKREKRLLQKQKKAEARLKKKEAKQKKKESKKEKKEAKKEKKKGKEEKSDKITKKNKEERKTAKLQLAAEKRQDKFERKLKKEKGELQKQLEKEYKSKYLLVDKSKLVVGSKETKKGILFIIFAVLLLFIGVFWNTILQSWKHALAAVIILAAVFIVRVIRRAHKISKTYKLFLKTQKHIRVWKKGIVGLLIDTDKDAKDVELSVTKIKPHIKSGIHHSTFKIEDNVDTLKYTCAFKISKRWFKHNEVPRDNFKLSKLTGQRWRAVRLEQTGEDKKYVYYSDNLKPGAYTLHGKPEYSKSRKKPMIAVIGSLIVILALIIITVPQSGEIKEEQTAGIPTQEWVQNEVHTLDLNKYFHDPDQDSLMFTATHTENIDIYIEKGIATLTPKAEWNGTEYVQFIADDGKNATVESNSVKLVVTSKLIPHNTQMYFAIVLSLAALIILYRGLNSLKKRI
jgi:Ca2+/Na+ antiporter